MERSEDQNSFATESLCPGRQFSGFPVYKGFSCAVSYLTPGRRGGGRGALPPGRWENRIVQLPKVTELATRIPWILCCQNFTFFKDG